MRREKIIAILEKLHRGYRPLVTSADVAMWEGCSARTARWWLHRLEAEGVVHRPHGVRGGYALTLDYRIKHYLKAARRPVRAPALAADIDVHHQVVWQHLRALETAGVVYRPLGKKKGYCLQAGL